MSSEEVSSRACVLGLNFSLYLWTALWLALAGAAGNL